MLRATPVLVLALVIGCGGGGADDDREKFVGTWKHTATSQNINCSDGSSDSGAVTGQAVITKGSGANELVYTSSGCTWRMTVSGNVATIQPGQVCNGTSDTGAAVRATPNSQSFSTTDGMTATLAANMTIMVTDASGSGTCTAVIQGTLNKAP